MAGGKVKWFNLAKGYGFIGPSDGIRNSFVHISAIERTGLSTLNEGQDIEFGLVPGQNGKSSAKNLVVKLAGCCGAGLYCPTSFHALDE